MTGALDWVDVVSPRGKRVTMPYRDGTSDLSLIYSSLRPLWETDPAPYDEYGLADLQFAGVGFDIGACIGSVTASLLADNPDLRMVAVEPLAENCAVIRAMVERNGWQERCRVIQGAIGPGALVPVAYGYDSTDYGWTNRYIGNLSEQAQNEAHETVDVPAWSLGELTIVANGEVAIAKFDCEGCEWTALADSAVAEIAYITGEWHGDPQLPGLHALLDATHEVTGIAQGVTGIFRAVRR